MDFLIVPQAWAARRVPRKFIGKSPRRPADAMLSLPAIGSSWHTRLPCTGLEETVPSCYPGALMSSAPGVRKEHLPDLPPRLKRILELVYAVPGVVAAQVWQCPGRIAVGVRGGIGTAAPACLLDIVQSAVEGLKEPGETWEFGILEDVVSSADAQARRSIRSDGPP